MGVNCFQMFVSAIQTFTDFGKNTLTYKYYIPPKTHPHAPAFCLLFSSPSTQPSVSLFIWTVSE